MGEYCDGDGADEMYEPDDAEPDYYEDQMTEPEDYDAYRYDEEQDENDQQTWGASCPEGSDASRSEERRSRPWARGDASGASDASIQSLCDELWEGLLLPARAGHEVGELLSLLRSIGEHNGATGLLRVLSVIDAVRLQWLMKLSGSKRDRLPDAGELQSLAVLDDVLWELEAYIQDHCEPVDRTRLQVPWHEHAVQAVFHLPDLMQANSEPSDIDSYVRKLWSSLLCAARVMDQYLAIILHDGIRAAEQAAVQLVGGVGDSACLNEEHARAWQEGIEMMSEVLTRATKDAAASSLFAPRSPWARVYHLSDSVAWPSFRAEWQDGCGLPLSVTEHDVAVANARRAYRCLDGEGNEVLIWAGLALQCNIWVPRGDRFGLYWLDPPPESHAPTGSHLMRPATQHSVSPGTSLTRTTPQLGSPLELSSFAPCSSGTAAGSSTGSSPDPWASLRVGPAARAQSQTDERQTDAAQRADTVCLHMATTGLMPGRVAQISYIRLVGDRVSLARDLYFSVENMEPVAEKIVGLSAADLQRLSGGRTVLECLPEIEADLADCLFVVHSMEFVRRFLEAERATALVSPGSAIELMRVFMPVLQLPGGTPYKWPSIREILSCLSISADTVRGETTTIFCAAPRSEADARSRATSLYLALVEGRRRHILP